MSDESHVRVRASAEEHRVYGLKQAQWFTRDDLRGKIYDKPETIDKLLGIDT
jgi:hypothetical protein